MLRRSPIRKRPQRKHEQSRLVDGLFAGLHRLGVAHRDQSPESLPAVEVLLERFGLLARSLELRPQKRCRRPHSAIERVEQALPELALPAIQYTHHPLCLDTHHQQSNTHHPMLMITRGDHHQQSKQQLARRKFPVSFECRGSSVI